LPVLSEGYFLKEQQIIIQIYRKSHHIKNDGIFFVTKDLTNVGSGVIVQHTKKNQTYLGLWKK